MKKLKSYLLTVLLLNVTSWVSASSLFPRVNTSEGENLERAETYKVRDPFYALDDPSVNRATSEHFQIIWGNGDTTGTVNSAFVQGNLKNLETIRSFYIDVIGLGDIGDTRNPSLSGPYKSNVYIALTGLDKVNDGWAYVFTDGDGCAYQVMMPGAMRVDPPSWVVPHELAHAVVFHNRGIVPFVWGESVANYLRNEYLYSDYYKYGETVYGPASDFFPAFLLNPQSHFPSGKNWYDIWLIFSYISENPDNIAGLGHQALVNIITYKQERPTFFATISEVTGVSIKDILGGLSRRLVTMDFKAKKYYLEHLDSFLKVPGHSSDVYTTLQSGSDGWMVVPNNRAPQQAGHNIVPLGVYRGKTSITVNFQGTSTVPGADWRVSIVTVTSNRSSRYSSMWNNGPNTMNLQGDEKAIYLVVIATPSNMVFLDLEENGNTFPYKIQVTTQ
ncbi:unnamed protein product [Adineta ricciae]|uniref:Uncharacterized protein n=1 Tax=Adineta ricciae TaxID=249248 RepID=A0A815GY48_ADIRI|nr:unnamed protein product [Adineta ricciae]